MDSDKFSILKHKKSFKGSAKSVPKRLIFNDNLAFDKYEAEGKININI